MAKGVSKAENQYGLESEILQKIENLQENLNLEELQFKYENTLDTFMMLQYHNDNLKRGKINYFHHF